MHLGGSGGGGPALQDSCSESRLQLAALGSDPNPLGLYSSSLAKLRRHGEDAEKTWPQLAGADRRNQEKGEGPTNTCPRDFYG